MWPPPMKSLEWERYVFVNTGARGTSQLREMKALEASTISAASTTSSSKMDLMARTADLVATS